jgi:salicylate hydroxylase
MNTGAGNFPFLVAGGGIAGLAAALALVRRGFSCHVLEREDEFGEVGAGIQIGPNVFRMFKVLGLTEAINATAVFPDALVMMDALSGQPVTRIPLNTDAFRLAFGFPYGVIYRPDLHAALLEACQAQTNITLETGARVVDFEDTGERVRVHLDGGRVVEGSALIGADGLWSKVREVIVGDGRPRVCGHIAYRAVLPTAQVPEELRRNTVILWAGPGTHLVHYPLHRGEIFNLVAVFHSDRYEEGWNVFGDVAELQRRFAGQRGEVHAMLDKIEAWRMWVLCDREPVKTWSKGLCVLTGDAAHPMLQYLAQGACMAIEDAVCLASKIAASRDDLPAAFAAFAAARYLRTARVQLTARFYGDVYHAAGVTAELRATLLGSRSTEQAYQGMRWLYSGLDDDGNQVL